MMNRPGIFRSVLVVGTGTAMSRVLGLVREVLMAFYFGTTLAKSAFDVAFQIPNLFRMLFGEGALSAAFIPVFAETVEKEGANNANRLAAKVMTLMAIVLAGLVLVGIVLATGVLDWWPMGERPTAVLKLTRIMLPYMFFICLVALSMAILNSFHRFMVPAMTSMLLNVVLIVAMMGVCPYIGGTPWNRVQVVAWAVIVAGVAQFVFQLPALHQVGFRWRLENPAGEEKVRRVVHMMGPVALGLGVYQVNVLVDGVLAMMVAPWAPAALTYAQRMVYLPLSIIATALGTVLLPTFSQQAARDDHEEILLTLGSALRNLSMVMIPASVGLIVLAVPLVELAFVWKHGVFDADSVPLTARAIWFSAPGLLFFSANKVLVPAFYALKDTVTPVKVAVRTVFLNFALNVAFILTWPEGFKHAGIPFATVLASVINCVILGWHLQKKLGSPGWVRFGGVATRSLIASLVMGVAIYCIHRTITDWMGTSKMGQLGAVAAGSVGGLAIYAAAAWLLCRREMEEGIRGWRQRRGAISSAEDE